MYAIVGLGNPGAQYEKTRHNIGHMVVAEIASRAGSALRAHRSTRTHQLTAFLGAPGQGERAVLATCDSFMNLSGSPVSSLLGYYDVPPENLIVIHDEMDFEPGRVKVTTSTYPLPPSNSSVAAAKAGTTGSSQSASTSARATISVCAAESGGHLAGKTLPLSSSNPLPRLRLAITYNTEDIQTPNSR